MSLLIIKMNFLVFFFCFAHIKRAQFFESANLVLESVRYSFSLSKMINTRNNSLAKFYSNFNRFILFIYELSFSELFFMNIKHIFCMKM